MAGAAKQGLLALSVGVGLAVVQELFLEEVNRLVGPRGRHDPGRSANRHGQEERQLTLGGRRVAVSKPRVRTTTSEEAPLRTYRAFARRDLLTEVALERMLAGLSSRHYEAGLESVGEVASRGHPAPPSPAASLLAPVRSLRSCLAGTSLPSTSSLSSSTLAKQLEAPHPGAAASLLEGLEETLTVTRLGIPPSLVRTFNSTNPIESMNSIGRSVTGNLQRWWDSQMVLRWMAAGMPEAEKQFRRIVGYRDLHILNRALQAHEEVIASTRTAA